MSYEPAVRQLKVKNLVDDLTAYGEIGSGLLKNIDMIADGVHVTKSELKRDYGFTDSSLRLLERMKLLNSTSNFGERKSYDLAQALRIRVFISGALEAKHLRTIRKHDNIWTIFRGHFLKLTAGPRNSSKTALLSY